MALSPRPWTVFGSVNTNLKQSYFDGAAQLGRVAAENNVSLFTGGSQLGLLGALFTSFVETRAALTDNTNTAHITSIPYALYYSPEDDDSYDAVKICDTLGAQQKALAASGDHLIALPGGIGTRGEIWNTIEELRCNPDYAHKHLWLMNIDGAFDALHADIRSTLHDGTTQPKDFTRVHIVNDADALAACVVHKTAEYPTL